MKQLLFLCLLIPWSGLILAEKPVLSADAVKRELVEIMKGVNFVPQLGKDEPLCKAFYEDFKTQKNIEHILPIIKAETYDDPALKPYQDKCPELDFHKSLTSNHAHGPENWTEEDWETLGIPVYGLRNFQFYKVDINNNPRDGEEFVFYYEGRRMIDRRLPVGGPLIEKEHVDPGARTYQAIDLKHCRNIPYGAVDQGGGVQGTRSGVIRYKGKNTIYILRQEFSLTLYSYSERLKRSAPTCVYYKAR